jgi:hypothetical protein
MVFQDTIEPNGVCIRELGCDHLAAVKRDHSCLLIFFNILSDKAY